MDIDNILISIIVPVYNVEQYLEKCIISLINQTHKKIEIILVDDGSTDKSGLICDKYHLKDSRVKVVHKSNGGLSDARNAGLDISQGTYIGFVDADDYVDHTMYRTLLEMCLKENVKISCVRFDTFGDATLPIPEPTYKKMRLTSDEFLMILCDQNSNYYYHASFSVWDRLYHKEVINGLYFPMGRCFEDILFTTRAIINAKVCYCYDAPLYHYRIRKNGSISNSQKIYSNRKMYTDLLIEQDEQLKVLITLNKRKLYTNFKVKYWNSLIYASSYNVYKEYDDKIKSYLLIWKPTFKELRVLNKNFFFRTKIFLKTFIYNYIIKIRKIIIQDFRS